MRACFYCSGSRHHVDNWIITKAPLCSGPLFAFASGICADAHIERTDLQRGVVPDRYSMGNCNVMMVGLPLVVTAEPTASFCSALTG